MTWVERNKDHIEKIRTYVLGFQNARPPVFEWFAGGSEPLFPYAPESDRGTAILLCFCALYQGIPAGKLMRLLAHLHDGYGKDFFRLGKLPFDDLQARIQAREEIRQWDILYKAPGILRSVSDFFFKHGRPAAWLRDLGDGEAAVNTLCEEVFMMGKTSALKSKPRYFLWLMTQLPGADPARYWTPATQLPITPGHLRFLRQFGPLKNRKHSPWITPEEKLAYCNRFFRLLFPENPWCVYTALDAYLKPEDPLPSLRSGQSSLQSGSSSVLSGSPGQRSGPKPAAPRVWLCRNLLGGCLQCVFAPDCPGCEEL